MSVHMCGDSAGVWAGADRVGAEPIRVDSQGATECMAGCDGMDSQNVTTIINNSAIHDHESTCG